MTALAYILGLFCAIFALWRSRTPQGATAWVVGLLSFPFLAVPLFLIFGRNKFFGYIRERKELDREAQKETAELQRIYKEEVPAPKDLRSLTSIVHQIGQPGFTDGNCLDLLVDGERTFEEMFKAIETAQKYILFQFYVFRADEIGNRFAKALMAKAQAGVRVYFLFDGVGTDLKSSYIKKLQASGIQVRQFSSMKGWNTHFQINFRNHRKVMVVDGKVAFLGGLNVGDDYLGKYPKIGPWRDTHICIRGPAAVASQLSFMKDWYWAQEKVPDLDWQSEKKENGCRALILHTGPADDGEACLLAHIAMINSARERIWIANPYIVPPDSLSNALILASLRGVDVRILSPSYTDNIWVKYASEVFIPKLLKYKIRVFQYLPGFLHQKVMLIDDDLSVVGSCNLDSRSIFINFEIMAVSPDLEFAQKVHQMLERDFQQSREVSLKDYESRSFWHQAMTRAVGLLAPML